MKKILAVMLLFAASSCMGAAPEFDLELLKEAGFHEDDIIIADWSDGTYQGWTTTGRAYCDSPRNLTVEKCYIRDIRGGAIGKTYVASSCISSRREDPRKVPESDLTGMLTSPEFKIERAHINFLMAGSRERDVCYVELLIDGKQVRKAWGNSKDTMDWFSFDVSEHKGKKAQLRLVDNLKSRHMGFISVGHVVQGNEQYGALWPDHLKDIETMTETFRPRFHFVAKSGWIGDPNGLVYSDGWYHIMSQARDFGLNNLGWGHARSRNMFDLEYMDRTAQPRNDSRSQKNRSKWIPPTSPNTALFPSGCLSGSAIEDVNNVTGLKRGEKNPILAFVSSGGYHKSEKDGKGLGLEQYVAVSLDGGISWKSMKESEGRSLPVIYNTGYLREQMKKAGKDVSPVPVESKEDAKKFRMFRPGKEPEAGRDTRGSRDPKVIWHKQSKKFVAVVYIGPRNYYAIYNSTNLEDWEWVSTLRTPASMIECPDLFELPVLDARGQSIKGQSKWVFMSNGAYIVGDFDGVNFKPEPYYETNRQRVLHGPNSGPLQLFTGAPDDRRIVIAWMKGGTFPFAPFQHQFTMPLECSLRQHADGINYLYCYPVKELEDMRKGNILSKNDVELEDGEVLDLSDEWEDLMDIEVEIEVGTAKKVGFQIKGDRVRGKAGADGIVKMRLVVDVSSYEVFCNDGETRAPYNFFRRTGHHSFPLRVARDHTLKIFAEGGEAKIRSLKIWKLREATRKDLSVTGKKQGKMLGHNQELREKYLNDRHIPLYHFVCPDGVSHPFDPNGSIFWKGEYHLMYIYQSGRNHLWGHVVSKDMLHWRQLPPALSPGDGERGIFWSGNTFINKAGVPTIAYYGVSEKKGVFLATAQDDDLIKWKKLSPNPVVSQPDRIRGSRYVAQDPHAWLEGDTYYAIFGGQPQGVQASVWKARTLDKWDYVGDCLSHEVPGSGINENDGVFDDISCPDLFRLGGKDVLMCISHIKGCRYYIGEWKNEQFHPDSHAMMNWPGGRFFANDSFLDDRGRRILIAWVGPALLKGRQRELGWGGVMSMPRVLTLAEDNTIRIKPIKEIEKLRTNRRTRKTIDLVDGTEVALEGISGDCMEIDLEIGIGSASQVGLRVRRSPQREEETVVVYAPASGKLILDVEKSSLDKNVRYGTRRPHTAEGGGDVRVQKAPFELAKGETLRLRVFLDRSIIEVYAADRQCVTQRIYPSRDDALGVSLFCKGGSAKVLSLEAWDMTATNPWKR